MSNVGDNISAKSASWSFGGKVPDTFEDHISKSVPSYLEGHSLILQLSEFFINDNSYCYELGTSTGLLSYKLSQLHGEKKSNFIGIDKVEAMISHAKSKYKSKNLRYELADALAFKYKPSDLMISYYLLQFVSPSIRQELVNKIFNNLNWGGGFICFEKVRAPDARFQDLFTTLYSQYKLDAGYKPDEIIYKTISLKGILEPFSTEGNIEMFKRAGFKDIVTIFKNICFEGFLCIK